MALTDFVVKTARPLPVIVLADTSGSMSVNGKIDALNQALKDMIGSFSMEGRMNAEIQVGLLTFGESVSMQLPLSPAHKISGFQPLSATGRTPMGQAFEKARELLEDKELIPSRAYRPVLILLSDGHPTDEIDGPLRRLLDSERAQKATRLSLAIGSDADEGLLKEFGNDLEAPLFYANDARDIRNFFRAVTMSVSARSKSQSPNEQIKIEYQPGDDDDLLDLDFE
ncbi:TPA: VWA domain-containing protein [Vibrio parahaemolyticus]|uniref:vWA domain-containing protein n=1 Tax=Vibrio parahaemolyticus TaxID=670 RepID=UPI0008134205|nr:VWA domain-containing protein [Vibrio parahaemolyticus]EGQ9457302.1 VWA domain-containing protein [Vibrio parahaemolyticus]EJE4689128.1 VWA domain-containing protein [Vibrio parahaemolyticus]EJK2424522.1 VWA domain-containing protein [Vibrio parahaemolyticus]EJO3860166.1 VWA domain-containing protein [Vibrio parahaemolyticus]ELB2260961.1 VWA domain-containing protein [Vibrio parahaemolyticus]